MESIRGSLAFFLCFTMCTPAPYGTAQTAPQIPQQPASAVPPENTQPVGRRGRPEYKSNEMQGDQRILQALNRFTFGPRPGDVEAVRAMGLEAWFNEQLHPASLDETELNARLAAFPAMQWSTQVLLYRVPSNALIRQAMNGRETVPEGPVLHAVYENQIYRLQEKRADQAEKKAELAQNLQPGRPGQTNSMNGSTAPSQDSAMAPSAAAAQIQASNGDATMAGSAPAGPPVSSSTILSQLDQLSGSNAQPTNAVPAGEPQMGAPANMASAPPAGTAGNAPNNNPASATAPNADPNVALVAELIALPPQQRVLRLAAMQPEEFDGFIKSLKGPQRARLEDGLIPGQRETVADLENPQKLVADELMSQRLARDIYSNAQLQEVMTDFWLNHFNVYLRKDEATPYYLVSYERDVIRPLALGKFEDLLEAVAHSPAMLLYLDNAESIGPDSPAAQRAKFGAARRPNANQAPEGLNENYARELMELHTLGVNGGYTQADVIQVARILTGWTVDQPQRGGGFLFAPNRHEPGTKKVMGKKIKEDGQKEGEELLHMLASRPATAQFLSRKLAMRFVSDDPPQSLVDRMVKTYMASGGDVSAVLKTLFHSPEFWAASDYRAKVKTPIEFVVSAARASNAQIESYQPLANALRQMGMPLYGCIPPTGYKWDEADWVSTGALVDRMNFALNLAANRLPGITVNWTQNASATAPEADAAMPSPEQEEARLEPLVVAGGVSDGTRSAALQQFAAQNTQEGTAMPVAARHASQVSKARPGALTALERQDQVLAGLLIGSPEFQLR